MPRHASLTSVKTPLRDHPQLKIISTPLSSRNVDGDATANAPAHIEYRVYNHRRLSDGKTLRGDGWGPGDVMVLAALAWTAWTWQVIEVTTDLCRGGPPRTNSDATCAAAWVVSLVFWLRYKCITVLYESLTPLPNLGIQLSTTRGLSFPSRLGSKPRHRLLIPLSTSHTFIPLSHISTVILNQGLTRFKVKYYIAIVRKHGEGVVVALDVTRPGFEVLREVYHGVRGHMFNGIRHTREERR